MNYNTNALKQEYLTQSVMTASPAELVVMLFDACIKNVKLAVLSLEGTPNPDKANTYFIKAQMIIDELVGSLDPAIELSGQLLPIYDFLLRSLRDMNIKKDASGSDDLLEILQSLRDTWQQIARPQGAPQGMEVEA